MMNLKNYIASCFHKSFFFRVLLILCVWLSALTVTNNIALVKEQQKTNWATSVDMIDQRMNSILYEINSFPRYAGNDMVFLSNLSHLEKVIETSGIERESNVKYLLNDFLAFLRENTAYYKLAYVDETGKPVATVVFDGKDYVIVGSNHSDANWFQKTNSLDYGEVFVSQLGINREGGQLENRGTAQNPKYVPILQYGAPVFADDGTKRGVVVSFVYADYFLDDIRAFGREGETVFLIDNKGNYLAHPDRTYEFAYLFGRDDSFQKDYPEAAKQVLSNPGNRILESSTDVFSFRAIYPTKGNFALFKGAEKLEKNSTEDYFWILVSVTDKKYLEKNARELIVGSGIFTVLVFAMIAGIAGTGYLLKKGKRK